MRKVADQSMIINDRGSKLEVLPTMRMRTVQKLSTLEKEVIHSVIQTEASAPISSQQLGVVFNHAMQVYGYITGEIAFKMEDGLDPTDRLDPVSYPGLAKLTNPDIYIVVAGTPSEFVEIVKRLQDRTDVEWVEPIVIHGDQRPFIDNQRPPVEDRQPHIDAKRAPVNVPRERLETR